MATAGVSTSTYTDFVPIVTIQENSSIFEKKEEKKYEKLSPAIKNKIDVSLVKIKIKATDTFILNFNIEKGSDTANDPDGNIKVIISFLDGSSREEIFTGKSYGDILSVTIKKEEIEEIYTLDFEYIDNEVKMLPKIKYQNCGLIVMNCVCDNWTDIASVIPTDKFVGYVSDCHEAAQKQIAEVGYKETWNRYQIMTAIRDKQGNVIKNRYYEKEFNKGVRYIKKALQSSIPVIIGIDDDPNITPGNPDKTTDHFVVIVGMGKDHEGNYFLFYDNAVGVNPSNPEIAEIGTSDQNRLYCHCDKPALIGQTDTRSSYGNGLIYTGTNIRESEKK